MEVQIIDPTKYNGWDSLILSHPDYSFFHSAVWAEVLYKSYGYTPLYFTVFEDGKLSALFPLMEVDSFLTGKRGVSLPFTDYCDPIISNGIQFQDVMDSIVEYGKERDWKYLEIRGGQTLLPNSPKSVTYLVHTLDLSDNEEEVFSRFRDSTKRNIKKAQSENVEVRILTTERSVSQFCRLNSLTRKRHGLPPQPSSFFQNLYERIVSKDLGFVVLAFIQQEPIAGAVYFKFGDKVVYKFGASEIKYQHLRANNLVMWEAIKWYSQNDYKSLCFGRTEPENQGLIQFKSGWGATEHQIHYYRYDFKKGSFVSGSSKVSGFHNRVFRRMPAPLLNKLGALLYKHVG